MKTAEYKNKTSTTAFPTIFTGDTNLPVGDFNDEKRQAVETALFLRATGYNIIEKKEEYGKAEKTIETMKHHPPDLSAIKYLLGNRFPERWQEKPDVSERENRDYCVVFGEYDENGNLIVPNVKKEPSHSVNNAGSM